MRIREYSTQSNGTYGYPRIHAELVAQGVCIGKHRVARLMRDNGLKALQKRRYKRTTDSHHHQAVAPNILSQDFSCDAPNRKWGADISYIWTTQGWLYLAIILDLYSRRIVGWATSDRLKKDLASTALTRALTMRKIQPGLIHHSDRGSQYCSYEYRQQPGKHTIVASMSSTGNCCDNAMVETVFKTIKNELLWRIRPQSRQQTTVQIGRYIDGFYNPKRRHSALGYKSPIQFEAYMALQRESLSTFSG